MVTDRFVELDCSSDMIDAGVSEVKRALAYPERFPHLSGFDRMRQRVANNIVSLAFRRYLSARKIPHKLIESVNFSQPDQLDISFGGRRCVPFAQLVCNRNLIGKVHKDPQIVLDQDVFLLEGSTAPAYRDVDIYLFIHLAGLVTRSRDDVERTIVAKQPVALVYQMPEEWSLHPKWKNLDPLVLKTDLTNPMTLDLYGQDQQRGYLNKSVHLPGRERVEIEPGFYALGAMQAARLPSGPVGLFSQTIGDTLLVAPFQWGNIWVYAVQMFITGYITQADFYKHARRIDAESAALVNPCLQDETLLALPVSALKPPQDLFIRAANWEQLKK